jgi:glycosyltransferase involved in cell wall biosynthesis
MPPISTYIITHNRADKISATIESAQWADEIVVVDSWSTDGNAGIATKLGARVVQVDFKGFGDLRNQAIAACTHEWIFSLDSDERCTPAASTEIQSIISNPDSLDVYWTPVAITSWIAGSGTRAGTPITANPSCFEKILCATT